MSKKDTGHSGMPRSVAMKEAQSNIDSVKDVAREMGVTPTNKKKGGQVSTGKVKRVN